MFMSEAWVLIAVTPVLYLLSGQIAGGLRLAMLALVFLVVADGLLSFVLTRSIQVSAKLPTVIEVGTATPVPVSIDWAIGAPVVAHFTGGITSNKATGLASQDGSLESKAAGRGSINNVTITVAAGAFLGLIGFVEDAIVTPAEPILAIPKAVAHPDVVARIEQLVAPTELELIGVRPYRAGDRPGDVHWPSVARTAEIMVREREAAESELPPITVIATAATSEALEPILEYARFAVEHAWRSGMSVSLVTNAPVSDSGLSGGAHPGKRRRLLAIPERSPAITPQLTHTDLTSPTALHAALAAACPGPDAPTDFGGAVIVLGELAPVTA